MAGWLGGNLAPTSKRAVIQSPVYAGRDKELEHLLSIL